MNKKHLKDDRCSAFFHNGLNESKEMTKEITADLCRPLDWLQNEEKRNRVYKRIPYIYWSGQLKSWPTMAKNLRLWGAKNCRSMLITSSGTYFSRKRNVQVSHYVVRYVMTHTHLRVSPSFAAVKTFVMARSLVVLETVEALCGVEVELISPDEMFQSEKALDFVQFRPRILDQFVCVCAVIKLE